MRQLYIVMYHYTRDLIYARYPNIKGMQLELFRKQIAFLKENFSVITMEEALAAAAGNVELPEKAALITFDDGYLDNYTYAFPILEEAGIQGSFFIPGKTFSTHQLLDVNKIHYILANADMQQLLTDVYERMDYYRGGTADFPSNEELFQNYARENRWDGKEIVFVKRMLQTVLPKEIRRLICQDLFEKYMDVTEEQLACELYMTADQIRVLKRHGMFIGIHGYDHDRLGELTPAQMQQDITKALDVMDEFVDRKHWVVNYPYGNYNQDVVDYVKSMGACAGVSTEVRTADLDEDDIMILPRWACNDLPPLSENYKRGILI